MSIARCFLPRVLLLCLFLSVVGFPLVEKEAGTAADPLTPEERAFVTAHGPIRYAPDPLFPPFEFLDPSGVARGITPDLLNIMSGKLGIGFRTVAYPTWSDVLEAVKRGEVDLLGTLTRTPEREGFLLFSRPYLSVPYVLFIRQDGVSPETVDDMVSRRLGVVRNYGINSWLSVEHPNLRPVAVEDTATGLAMVATGQLDALLETLPVGAQIVRDRSLTNIRVVPRHIYTLPQHFGVRKGEPLLLSIVQKGLDSLTETERSEAFVRWTGQDFSRPPPAMSPFFRNALLALIVGGILSAIWIAALKRSVRRATQSLRETEERYRDLVENAKDIIYTHDLAGNFTSINKEAERVTGYSRDEAVKMNIDSILAPEDVDLAHRMLSYKVQEDDPSLYELEIVCKNGRRVPIEISTKVIRKDGLVIGVQGIARDITERKRAQELLQISEKRFRDMLENVDLIGVMFDRGGEILFCNTFLLNLTGWSMEEVLHRSWFDLFLPEEDRNEVKVVFSGNLDDVKSYRTHENPIVTRGGERRLISWSNTALFDSRGAVIGVAAIGNDITDARRNEVALRKSENRLRVILDSTGDGILAVDAAGKTVFSNRRFAELWHIPQSLMDTADDNAMLDFVLEQLVDPDGFLRKVKQLYGTADLANDIILFKDGRVFERVSVPMMDDGSVVGRLWSFRDVTDRKQAEEERGKLQEQLQQAMKMEAVGRLAGGVAHDFNNLLTVIMGNIALALRKLSPTDPAGSMLSEANKAAERAAALTQQLLAFSREQIIEPKILDLNLLISDLGKMLVCLIGENIELKTFYGEDLGLVKVDAGQLEQVLANLAVNAKDAMPDGGKIIIETANVDLDEEYCARHPNIRPGRYVLLAVSDTGLGMTEEVRKQVFEPFFTTKPKGSGTGLGLATIYGVVKQAGGSIEVYSEMGKGTTFKISLPRVEGEAARFRKSDLPTELPRGSGTVLLVEDEENLRNLGVRILKDLGYTVMQAGNGDEAIALAKEHKTRIDLLMTDVVMPGMHGRELADRLARIHPETRVLFTSGYTDNAIVHHGVLDEGVSFLGKPYFPSALARKVREVLDKV